MLKNMLPSIGISPCTLGPVLPCVSLLVSEYLSYLHETKRSYAVVLSAYCALKWVHDLIPFGAHANPVDTALNHSLVQASKRAFSRPVNKKEPITPDMIHRLCVHFAHEGSNLRDLRTAVCLGILWSL